jgi:integrase
VGGDILENLSVAELAERTRDLLIDMGIQPETAWYQYRRCMLPIVELHKTYGREYFDKAIVDQHVKGLEARFANGEIGYKNYSKHRMSVNRLTEMNEKGMLEWTCRGKPSRFVSNEYYENIMSKFINDRDWHSNTRNDVLWVARKFFFWLVQNGYKDLSNVGADQVMGFMVSCGNSQSSSGVYDVKLYLRHLCDYLFRNGLLRSDFKALLSFRVNRATRLLPATPWSEIEAVLKTIDRLTPKGKRDYAMILLAAVTGLRAVDIMRMKLTDIDWRLGDISIYQSKTSGPVALPLTKDVGEAIQDYLLNGRPHADSDAVFLRVRAPYRAFADTVAIENMYDSYRARAGLPRAAFDGKGFHSLRRTAGTSLVTADVPVTTVAQILGHSDIKSAKKYIALDVKHLRECALGLSGIGLEAGL